MADRLDGLDPEERERLLAAFQAADIELDILIANWPASYELLHAAWISSAGNVALRLVGRPVLRPVGGLSLDAP